MSISKQDRIHNPEVGSSSLPLATNEINDLHDITTAENAHRDQNVTNSVAVGFRFPPFAGRANYLATIKVRIQRQSG